MALSKRQNSRKSVSSGTSQQLRSPSKSDLKTLPPSPHLGQDWFPRGDTALKDGLHEQLSRHPALRQILARFWGAIVTLESGSPDLVGVSDEIGLKVIETRSKNRFALIALTIFTELQKTEEFDLRAGPSGHKESYSTGFIDSLELPEGLGQLLSVVDLPSPRDHIKAIPPGDHKARVKATLLRSFDDRRRMGIPVSEVIQFFATPIHQAALSGDADFFLKLGQRISKPVVQKGGTAEKSTAKSISLSLGHWIQYNWLPLALWRFESKQAAELLLAHADTAKLAGLRVPDGLTKGAVLAELRRFRQRLKCSKRPNWPANLDACNPLD